MVVSRVEARISVPPPVSSASDNIMQHFLGN